MYPKRTIICFDSRKNSHELKPAHSDSVVTDGMRGGRADLDFPVYNGWLAMNERVAAGFIESSAPHIRRNLTVLAGVVVIWEVLGRLLEIQPDLLPTPSRILLETWRHAPELRRHASATAVSVTGGLFAGVCAGVPIGLWAGSFAAVGRTVLSIVTALEFAPLVALVPVFLLWFGYGPLPHLAIVALISLVTIASGVLKATASISPLMPRLMRAMGASPAQILWKLRLTAILPGLFQSLARASALSVAAAVTAEFVEADAGLGYLMLSASTRMNTPLLFASLLALFALAALLHAVTFVTRESLIPWHIEIGGATGEFSIQRTSKPLTDPADHLG